MNLIQLYNKILKTESEISNLKKSPLKVVSNIPPIDKEALWLDTSVVPNELKFYENSNLSWKSVGSSLDASFTPTGGISSTSIKDAIIELDSKKAKKDSPTFTGTVVLPNTSTIGAVTYANLQSLIGLNSPIQNQIDGIDTKIGTLSNLPTLDQTDIVNSITEVYNNVYSNKTNIGDMTVLSTTDNSNLVVAINEIKLQSDSNKSSIQLQGTYFGDLTTLTTTNKSTLVASINELKSTMDSNATKIGNTTNLTTSNKVDLVSAINEVKSGTSDQYLKADAADPSAGYLKDKIDGVTITANTTTHKISAKTLSGLNATITELNYVSGAKSNIQSQLDAIGNGMTMKGETPTYASLIAMTGNTKGDTWIVAADETRNGARTMYTYNDTQFVFVNDYTTLPDASFSSRGVIQLSGDIANPNSLPTNIQLIETGVIAGTYSAANIIIDSKGRIVDAESGIDDTLTSSGIKTWSVDKLNSLFNSKQDELVINNTAPTLPVANELWIDNTNPTLVLKVYDGAQWTPISSGTRDGAVIFDWMSTTDYKTGDVVTHSSQLYQANVDHTSTTDFDTDLANSYWALIGANSISQASSVHFDNTGTTLQATNVQDVLVNIDSRTSSNSTKINANQIKVTEHDTKITEYGNRLTAIEAVDSSATNTLVDHNTRITSLETKEFNSENRITSLEGNVTSFNARFITDENKINDNITRISNVESGINSNTTRISTLEGNIVNNATRISTIEGDYMQKSVYIAGAGVVKKAVTLDGLTSTIKELNYVAGVVSPIQAQINAIASGTQFKGSYETFSDMTTALPTPLNGWMTIVRADENNGGARTTYIYNDSLVPPAWDFIGTADFINDASDTVKGAIRLAGDLTGVADAPELTSIVEPGTHNYPTNITIDSKGRVLSVTAGSQPSDQFVKSDMADTTPGYLTDKVDNSTIKVDSANHQMSVKFDDTGSSNKSVWSAQKVTSEIAKKEDPINKNIPGGYAGVDSSGKIPVALIPQAPSITSIKADNKVITSPAIEFAGGTNISLTSDLANSKIIINTGLNVAAHQNIFRYESLASTRAQMMREFTTPNYIVGANSLLVFVDGTLQKNGIDYEETDIKMVTFLYDIDVDKHVTFWNIGGATVPTLKEVTGSVIVPSKSSQTISLDVGFSKYDIRTIYALSSSAEDIEVYISDKATDGFVLYNSIVDNEIYDIVNAPCEDKDGTQKIHVTVKNNGSITASIDLIIKITNLL